jgi:alpha-galactosidase
MPRAIRLGVIGAGSATFSVGLVRDICLTESLAGSSVVLMDVDRERVETMHRFAVRYAGELGAKVSFEWTTEREAALREADFVINTAQVGGHTQVERLRAWSEARGYYRGFRLKDCLQVRMMVSVVRDMERLCPGAWLIQASNPVFEGCTAMTRATGIKVCGLCHGHTGYYEIAEVLGLDESKVKAQVAGFNHEVWLTNFEYEGRDAYPLIDEWIETKSEQYWSDYHPHYGQNQMSRAAVELYKLTGLFPIGDTPRRGGWWYHTDLETKKRWYGAPLGGFDSEIGWAMYLQELEKRVQRIHHAAHDLSVRLTHEFKPRITGEQHFPLIDALVNDNEVTLQVNVPNRGAIEGIPGNVVVELPAVCSHRSIQPLQIGKLPEVLMLTHLYPRLLEAEHVVALSLHPDERVLMRMLLDDHRTKSWEEAVRFAREIMSLPEFAEMAGDIVRPRHGFDS